MTDSTPASVPSDNADKAPVTAAVERLERAVAAVDRDFALFGNHYGRAIPVGRDMLREIVRTALEAADAT